MKKIFAVFAVVFIFLTISGCDTPDVPNTMTINGKLMALILQ